ncbi:hypothetical protein LTR91_020493 [Friedmanniomyces endolithicus]|uniref:Uncharacterized protein n=2 Tax=Dothideomycetidae TaxID=451867 RepID=A0A4U0V9D2_9PEZI|nr:hypothetical protein LTS09_016239 [Friedmanniomyces endolithicus]KAK0346572.1 hypothetical protein LTR94_006033 [Friedmanniomyces endolithicus]KAK0781346.1 hypothetical protein LTR38_013765 [Friedmanniomyces endolithicus]KAK0802985.1 hypothetical protein LTR59_004832 [Friedmanniomyces endolithicus]KAK0807659.1 hypothetical protein LTR75_006533 [Friedmanniomyces endolithicus]
MPVLHHLYQRAASLATDTRTLESRQLRALAHRATQALATAAAPNTLPLANRNPPITLVPRQYNGQLVAIPYFYQYGGPAPAAVAGIVLGSVAGFLLLLWLFWTLSNGSGFIRTSEYSEQDRDRERGSRSRRSSRQTNTEMRSRSPPRRERVIRQERIVREVPVQRERESSRVRETVIIDDEGPPPMRGERRVEGDDIAGLPLRGSRF